MALEWFDGWLSGLDFDWTTHGSPSISAGGPSGRLCVNIADGEYIERSRPSTTYVCVGFEVLFESASSPNQAQYGSVVELVGPSGTLPVLLRWKTDAGGEAESEGGYLNIGESSLTLIDDDEFYNGSSSGNRLQLDTWYFIELYVYSNTNGAVRLHVENEQWVGEDDMIDVNTTTQGATADYIRFGGGNVSQVMPGMRIGSVYCLEATTTKRLGKCRIAELSPTADGAHTDFTPETGANHYAMVDDASPGHDYDATRCISLGTVGHKDSFTTTDTIGGAATVLGYAVDLIAYDPQAASKQMRANVKSGTTTGNGTAAAVDDTGYGKISHLWETNPDTGVAFTQAEAEAAEFSYEITT